MKHLLIPFLALFLIGATGKKNAYQRVGELIDDAGLDTTPSFSMTNIPSSGTWGLMVVYVQVTDANDSVTALNMTCTGSIDNNTTDYTMQDCTVSGGTATCVDLSWTKDPSGIASPKRWPWRVDVEGFEDVECTFTNTGGVAADKLDVSVAMATKE